VNGSYSDIRLTCLTARGNIDTEIQAMRFFFDKVGRQIEISVVVMVTGSHLKSPKESLMAEKRRHIVTAR